MGYNEESGYTWVKHYRVRDEILEKHSGLSDDGYLELTEEYGGSYKREEVFGAYVEPIKRWSKNSILDSDLRELCSCIHLYEAQKWLREEWGFNVLVDHIMTEDGDWCYNITHLGHSARVFKSYEEALSEGIKEAVKLLKEK